MYLISPHPAPSSALGRRSIEPPWTCLSRRQRWVTGTIYSAGSECRLAPPASRPPSADPWACLGNTGLAVLAPSLPLSAIHRSRLFGLHMADRTSISSLWADLGS